MPIRTILVALHTVDRAEEIIRKVTEIARTGRIGDGKIVVLPAESYEQVIDIDRTT